MLLFFRKYDRIPVVNFLGAAMYELEMKIERMLSDERIAGCEVAITDRKGIIWSRGFGVANADLPDVALTVDTVFRAASITKVITGILVMRLVEDGKIDLDIPVREYLPWFTIKDENAAAVITMRHLLSHRSGLPGEYTPDGPHDEGALEASLREGLPTLELLYSPGDGYTYSNWGIRLASLVVEKICGERYSSLARKYVLDPLGMEHSTYFLSDVSLDSISWPHVVDESGTLVAVHEIKENYTRLATGGLYSSARELSRLGRLILNGGVADDGTRVISSASLYRMMEPRSLAKTGNRYGITMMIHDTQSGLRLFGHYGNANPYTSALMVDPKSGYGVVVLLNTYSETLREKIIDAAIEHITNVNKDLH